MATRVEINSTLASLTTVPDLKEIRSEEKAQRVYVSVLSDASNKTKEASASLALEESKKFGSALRSATMPSLGSRPRLFPKPFSKEKPSDAFANVKPPVPAFRSSSLLRKAPEETSSAKGLSGNIPPLVDQRVIESENKAGGEMVTNVTFYTGPTANTVILFEAAGTEQSKVSLAQGKRVAEDCRVFSSVHTKELQCTTRLEKPSETSRAAEGSLHRQVSFCSSLRPVTWNSLKTGEKKDAHEAHPGEKSHEEANSSSSSSSKVDFSADVQPRPKHRPVSAIFLESLRDQKHRAGEAPEEKPPAEKSWARKPRPLSMDLTAKFEQKDPPSCKKPCSPHESKENLAVIALSDVSCHGQPETGPKSEETEPAKSGSCRTSLRCSSQDVGILNHGKYTWETKLPSKSEQSETKPEVATGLLGSERSQEATGESRTAKGGKRADQKETTLYLGSESPAAPSEKESNAPRGSVKKHMGLFAAENPSAPGDAELLPSAAEKESRCVTIQQRIRELTTETAEAKPGNPRRSLQSRPLSADLTKMFSSPMTSSEAQSEKAAETRNSSTSDMQEKQKGKEVKLAPGTDATEAHAAGNPWKARQVLKITNKADPVERRGSFLGDGQHFPQQGENPASFTSNLEKKLKPSPLTEKPCVKTVRATVFDHNVQRHSVAGGHPGTDSALKMSSELEVKPEVVTLGPSRRLWMGDVEETTSVRQEYHKQSGSSKHTDVERSGKPACSSEEKKMTSGILLEKPLPEKSEKPPAKTAEDSIVCQRVEPRYEIFQTCGERALSEAITMAPEKKAMTLRARKSSVRESKLDEDVLHAGQAGRATSKTLYLREENVISGAGDTKALMSKSALREPNDLSSSECTLPEQKKDADRTEAGPLPIAERAPYSTSKSKCVGVNENVGKLPSEMKSDQGDVSSMEKAERSNMMKCSSEKRSFRPGGAESSEFRTSLDWEVLSTSVNKHVAQSSAVLSSGQFCKSPSSHHPDPKVLLINKEESRAFGLRRSLELNHKEQDFSSGSAACEKIRVMDPEEKLRRSRSSVSDLKVSERWRRRTLPQDSVKTEEVVWLASENLRRLSQTDSLQLDESSVKRRSKKGKEGLEGSEANQALLASPGDGSRNQSSAFEPKATYYAVTYQPPGTKKEKSPGGAPSASEMNSGPSEGAATNLEPVFAGRFLQHPAKTATSTNCRGDSREVHFSKDQVKEDDKGDVFSKNLALGSFHVPRKDNQQYHERGLDHSKESIIDVDALLLKQERESTTPSDLKSSRRRVSSYHEPRSPPRFAQSPKDTELVPQKRSENGCALPGKKAEDGYRSQILDIDALMAEYKEESAKAVGVQDKLPGGHSSLTWEKSKNKRNVSDRTSSSYSWKEWKGSDHSPIANKAGDCAGDSHRPERVIVTDKSKEKLESCSPEFEKQKCKDRKFSPPYWGNPSSFSPEKLMNSPVEFTRKKTFIVDEDEEVNLTSRTQSSKFVIEKVQPVKLVSTDQRWEVNFASKLSIKTDDGHFQKRLITTEQVLEVSPEGDWSKSAVRSSVARSKDDVKKTACESDPSNVKGKTDWRSYTAALGGAPTDLRRSYSEKIRQGKDNPPLGQEVRGRKEPHRCRQSLPLESVDSGWKHRVSPPSEIFFQEDKKAPRKEWTKQSSDRPEGTDFSLASTPRSRHSFYKERKVDNGTDQLKQCFSRQPPGAKDTDTLVQEPDSQYGTWNEQRHSGDSFAAESPSSEADGIATRKQPPGSHPSSLSSQTEPASLADHHDFSKDQRSTSLDRSSTDMDSTDGTDLPPPGETCPDEKTTDFSFIDQTAVLDSSALKTRVQLSKKRRRRVPVSHSLRRSRGLEFENRFSLTEEPDNAWMFKDSTEEKKTMQQEDSEEEERIHRSGRSSSVHAQRLPVFPGMDHSALKAQLRRRHEAESAGEISSAQLFKSPKSQLGTPGSRVLPSSVEKEERSEEKSPQWLKELKSKKRQSHYENQV